jgi:UDP-N-acetylmuramoyl-tripeptide--D-alanyl-D-alanine ligase
MKHDIMTPNHYFIDGFFRMIRMTITEAANILGINCNHNDEFHGITSDSRKAQTCNLFVAIPGENFDGHDYVQEAFQKGASAALVTHHVDCAIPQLIVPDTTIALGQLSAAWRQRFSLPIVAVTGSNGKTTLKNMIASIMKAACNGNEADVLATQGTLNNHWGLPLTLARLTNNHRYAAIEMGMNHFGEIAYLTNLTKPTVAVINNAAAAHLEGVGDVAGVARAKAEIFQGLTKDGMAILNRDDPFYSYWLEQIGTHSFLSFGFSSDADVHATLHETTTTQNLTLHTPRGDIDIALPLLGKHNALNTLAAAAATLAVGIPLPAIKKGIENISPAPGRLQMRTLENGVNIIDDTYNANPFSLKAAVDTLATFNGKKILVLGDMRELGTDAKSLHHAAGEAIRAAGINYLFTFGDLSANTSLAFGDGAHHFKEQGELVNALKPYLHNQTTVLVKGSRSMRMEKVIASIVE